MAWGPTKSRRERVVPNNPVLHAALQVYHRWRGAPTEGPAFLGGDGKRLGPSRLGARFWPQAQVTMGLVDVRNGFKGQHKHRFHDLRHTAGSFWIIQGVPLETVSDWLGHRNYSFTKAVYIHQLEHDQRGTQALHQLSDYLVDRMAQRGMLLPASEPIKLIEPPKPPEADQAIAPPLPTRDLTETEERIAELWRQGRYIYEIADETGEQRETVRHVLEELGLKDRVEFNGGRRPSKYSDEEHARVIGLICETNPDGSARYSVERISENTGVPIRTLRLWCANAGLEKRGRFTPKSARVGWAKSLEVRQQVIDLFSGQERADQGDRTAHRMHARHDQPFRPPSWATASASGRQWSQARRF